STTYRVLPSGDNACLVSAAAGPVPRASPDARPSPALASPQAFGGVRGPPGQLRENDCRIQVPIQDQATIHALRIAAAERPVGEGQGLVDPATPRTGQTRRIRAV